MPGQTLPVNFTVHNLEYQTTNYQYKITETSQDGNQNQVLAMGKFTLPQNAYHKTAVNIPTVDLGPNVKVKVDLVNVNESIDYLVQRRGA
jgi:hypothetical protein